jgi:hypothetical protein
MGRVTAYGEPPEKLRSASHVLPAGCHQAGAGIDAEDAAGNGRWRGCGVHRNLRGGRRGELPIGDEQAQLVGARARKRRGGRGAGCVLERDGPGPLLTDHE